MKSFRELELIKPLCRALAEEQYEVPTEIQGQTIPHALAGRDVLGCAQTGTGKTAAFALPILQQLGEQNLKPQPNRPQVLVLAPTRELAIQIGDSFATYGRHLRIKHTLVYGGVGQVKQVRDLGRGVHVLVATPGRLLDLMNQGHVSLKSLSVFVLDEADRMMDMGFLPDLKRIMAALPERRQSLFFSATLPPKIVELSQQLLRDPASVTVTPTQSSVERIEQRVVFVEQNRKHGLLERILQGPGVGQTIVFTKTKRGANRVTESLIESGIRATVIHGNKSQSARQRALGEFRSENVQVLVATDVAARGIDVDGITHVVNFELPMEPENYVHRIGRTGRAGASGIALTLCSSGERGMLRTIERLIGQRVDVDQEHSAAEIPADKQPVRPAGGPRKKSRFKGAKSKRGAQPAKQQAAQPAAQRTSQPKTQRAGQPASQSGGPGKNSKRRRRRNRPSGAGKPGGFAKGPRS